MDTSGTASAETLDLAGSYAMAFGTPIATYPWESSEELNEKLRQRILQLEQQSPGITRSNVRSWHSSVDLLQDSSACVGELTNRIKLMVGAMTQAVMVNPDPGQKSIDFALEGWANVTRNGGYNTVHNHPNAIWSGTYYVASGEAHEGPTPNGKLELLDPRAGTNMMNVKGTIMEGRYVIDPIPGLMVMFPSWLSHFVHPFFGEGERISVAFNVTTLPQKQLAFGV